MPVLASSASEGFSVSLLAAAAGVALGWLAVAAGLGLARRPPHIRATGSSMDLPPESPALAGLLVNDFVLPSEAAPAIVLDLAARGVLDLDEVQPGKTICRLLRTTDAPLTDYEQQVLASLRDKAIDGVVPTDALTTGPEQESASWHRALNQKVVAEGQGKGLTRDRWPKVFSAVLLAGLVMIGALIFLASKAGGDDSGDRGIVAAVAGATAVGIIVFGIWLLGRLSRSLAQLPTDAGRAEAARVADLERLLHEDRELGDLPPAAVKVRGRHLAYAAAFGAAPFAVALLPMGAEDNHRAWSRVGGHWRRVRVRYPRLWPPGWGREPVFAVLLALLWTAVAGVAIRGLIALADSTRPIGIPRNAWDWVERGALIATVPFVILAVRSLVLLVEAVPDLFGSQTVTGDVVRARRFSRAYRSGNNPSYWFYLAIDDGTRDRIRALRVRETIWSECSQGDSVTAEVTARLGFVRALSRSGAPGDRSASA